jgi:hypothetical protein
MADLGTTIVWKPAGDPGYQSRRPAITRKIFDNDPGGIQNFYFGRETFVPVGQPDETAGAFAKKDPFEVEVKDRLTRIETKLDTLLAATANNGN